MPDYGGLLGALRILEEWAVIQSTIRFLIEYTLRLILRMRLSVGEKLGPYEVFAPVGTGEEVDRALDSRLNREVAIKISTGQFTERFERDARAMAASRQLDICTLYDVGSKFLVEGLTLTMRGHVCWL
jgi:hypothetical protein